MGSINFPAAADIADTIADCLDVVHVSAEHRDTVIQNSLCPVSMLMEAGRLASAAGPDEAAVFEYFLHCLNAQVEMQARERAFAQLVGKLANFKKMH